MNFFDEYPRFYETIGTRLRPNRFRQRHKAIIGANAHLLRDAGVLDLASHDGRWAFAALKTGARSVVGVEAREELVRRGRDTFAFYGVDPARAACWPATRRPSWPHRTPGRSTSPCASASCTKRCTTGGCWN